MSKHQESIAEAARDLLLADEEIISALLVSPAEPRPQRPRAWRPAKSFVAGATRTGMRPRTSALSLSAAPALPSPTSAQSRWISRSR